MEISPYPYDFSNIIEFTSMSATFHKGKVVLSSSRS